MDNTKLKSRMSEKVQALQDIQAQTGSVADAAPVPVDSSYLALTNNAIAFLWISSMWSSLPRAEPRCFRCRGWPEKRRRRS